MDELEAAIKSIEDLSDVMKVIEMEKEMFICPDHTPQAVVVAFAKAAVALLLRVYADPKNSNEKKSWFLGAIFEMAGHYQYQHFDGHAPQSLCAKEQFVDNLQRANRVQRLIISNRKYAKSLKVKYQMLQAVKLVFATEKLDVVAAALYSVVDEGCLDNVRAFEEEYVNQCSNLHQVLQDGEQSLLSPLRIENLLQVYKKQRKELYIAKDELMSAMLWMEDCEAENLELKKEKKRWLRTERALRRRLAKAERATA